jgi:hypothetical protein
MKRKKSKKKIETFSDINYKPNLERFVNLIRSDIEVVNIIIQEADYEYGYDNEDSITVEYKTLETVEEFKKRAKSDLSNESIENLFALEKFKERNLKC